jgi:hypothetical protein
MNQHIGRYPVVNPRAPVTAWPRTNFWLGTVVADEFRIFRNLAEFKEWYREKRHGEARVNSRYLFTDVLVDTIGD